MHKSTMAILAATTALIVACDNETSSVTQPAPQFDAAVVDAVALTHDGRHLRYAGDEMDITASATM